MGDFADEAYERMMDGEECYDCGANWAVCRCNHHYRNRRYRRPGPRAIDVFDNLDEQEREMKDAIRNVFDDPDIGDVIEVDREVYAVERMERHGGKTHVVVQINGVPGRRRWIDLASWREYKHDPDAKIVTNRSITDAFE